MHAAFLWLLFPSEISPVRDEITRLALKNGSNRSGLFTMTNGHDRDVARATSYGKQTGTTLSIFICFIANNTAQQLTTTMEQNEQG